MAVLCPLKGLRFAPSAGSLDTLVAPPHDDLSPSERDRFAAKNPQNIVHLTLPEGKPDDRSKYIKYARAGALLGEWRREGTLVPDLVPSLYRYTQRIEVPQDSPEVSVIFLVCLLKLEPLETGNVICLDRQVPTQKDDRLRLLEATRTHLEPILGVYEDFQGMIYPLICNASAQELHPGVEDGDFPILEAITDPSTIQSIVTALLDQQIFIAEGVDRYETALRYRQSLGAKSDPIPEDFILIALAPHNDAHPVNPSLVWSGFVSWSFEEF